MAFGTKRRCADFRGVARRVLEVEGAELLPSTLAGETAQELYKEVAWLLDIRSDLKSPVLHRTISLAPGETLEATAWWYEIDEYMEKMGYGMSPWFAVKHAASVAEGRCEIAHIVCVAIDLSQSDRWGRPRRVNDGADFKKSALLLQAMEKRRGLKAGAMTPEQAAKMPWRQVKKDNTPKRGKSSLQKEAKCQV